MRRASPLQGVCGLIEDICVKRELCRLKLAQPLIKASQLDALCGCPVSY